MKQVGVIGCGGIFEMHAVSLSLLDDVKIVAVCDIKQDRAKSKSEKYYCNFYIDYIEMFEREHLDVVHICTPHYLHAEMSLEAIKRKIDIVCEKPMALTYSDAEKVICEAQRNHVKYAVVFQNRYNPGSVLAYEELMKKEIGEIISAKIIVTWDRGMDYYNNSDWKGTIEKEGGGVIIDQAIHSIDLIRWLIPEKLHFVSANCYNRLHSGIDVEDEAVGVFYLKDIPIDFYTVNYFTMDSPVEIVIHCTKGIIKISGEESDVLYNNGFVKKVRITEDDYIDFGEGAKEYWGTSHYKLIADYYNTNLADEWNHRYHNSYLNTQVLITNIYESSKLSKPICFGGNIEIHDKTFDLANA